MEWGWCVVKIKNFGYVKFKSINIQCRILEEKDGWGLGEKSGQLSARGWYLKVMELEGITKGARVL